MIFNEIYSNYFNAVAAILKESVRGELSQHSMMDIIMDKAFGESVLTIPEDISSAWGLLHDDFSTPLCYEPEMPLTTLQKRWLKTLLEDPRIALFAKPERPLSEKARPALSEKNHDKLTGTSDPIAEMARGLEDVKPLFDRDSIVYFDKYGDGDPFTDEKYIRNFHTVLEAFETKRKLNIKFVGSRGKHHKWECIPYWLEYSEKDDKFRLIIKSALSESENQSDRASEQTKFGNKTWDRSDRAQTINMARIDKCSLGEAYDINKYRTPEFARAQLVLEVTDERNALERVMLNFSHYAKVAKDIGDNKYRVAIEYNKEDETELLIRVLSFGAMVKIISPRSFIKQAKGRIDKQMELIEK